MIEMINSSQNENWCFLKWGIFEKRNLEKKFISLMMDFPNANHSVAEVLEEKQLLSGKEVVPVVQSLLADILRGLPSGEPFREGTSCVMSHAECHWCPRKSQPGPYGRTAPCFPQSWEVNLWGNDSGADQGSGHLWQDAACLQLPATRSQDRAESRAGEAGAF